MSRPIAGLDSGDGFERLSDAEVGLRAVWLDWVDFQRRDTEDRRHRMFDGRRQAHGVAVAVGAGREGGHFREGTGAIPWYVPEGAEFDYEQGHGYRGLDVRPVRPGENPWRWIDSQVLTLPTERERHLADRPWEEYEDFAGEAWAPVRPTLRPVHPDVYADWSGVVDPEVEALIAEAEADPRLDAEYEAKKEAEKERKAARKAKKGDRRRPSPHTLRERRRRARAAASAPRTPLPDVEDVHLPEPVPEDPELCGWPEPAPVEPVVREEVEPVPEPEVARSDYANAMERVWGSAS